MEMKTVRIRKRGCGYPKQGGFYAIGAGKARVCFALPVELTPCKCCMQMPKFARCPTKVTSEYLHQLFFDCESKETCRSCVMDNRDYWISWIGSDYDTDSFIQEVNTQGLSRRIPPSFAKAIRPGDYFANVKNGKIISLVPITSIRYYVKEGDDEEKLKKLKEDGVDVCKMDLVNEEETQMTITE
jgi:hypothetical protein